MQEAQANQQNLVMSSVKKTASLVPRVRKGPGYETKGLQSHSKSKSTLAIKPVSNRLCLNQVWPNHMWFTESGFQSVLGSIMVKVIFITDFNPPTQCSTTGVVHAILHTITVLIKAT